MQYRKSGCEKHEIDDKEVQKASEKLPKEVIAVSQNTTEFDEALNEHACLQDLSEKNGHFRMD